MSSAYVAASERYSAAWKAKGRPCESSEKIGENKTRKRQAQMMEKPVTLRLSRGEAAPFTKRLAMLPVRGFSVAFVRMSALVRSIAPQLPRFCS